MADIIINTDGTIKGTKLTVDGKDLTKSKNIVDISLYASAPYISKWSGDTIPGNVSVSFSSVDSDGKIERNSYGESDINFSGSVGKKIKSKDEVVRFIGHEVDDEVTSLVDKIVAYCESNNIPCPSRDKLESRSAQSLRDKADDIGLNLED